METHKYTQVHTHQGIGIIGLGESHGSGAPLEARIGLTEWPPGLADTKSGILADEGQDLGSTGRACSA